MLTIPKPKNKDETYRNLVGKFFLFSEKLRDCKRQLRKTNEASLKACYEVLMDHYGNQAQINLFKIEIEWEEIKELIKEAL